MKRHVAAAELDGDLTDLEAEDEPEDAGVSAVAGAVPGFGVGGDALGLDDDGMALPHRKKSGKSGGFQSMGLSMAVLRGVLRQGFKVPTPIQRRCIPLVLEGRDVVGMARTGSGKTVAFVVPMLEKLKAHSAKVGVRAIVLSPSRELAFQTLKVVKEIGRFMDLRVVGLVGGDSMDDQFAALTNNPDVLVATPGRLMHLCVEMELSLSTVEYVVFDEADRLFEMGFEVQLREILHRLPSSRQTLLFSATLPKLLVDFAKAGLSDPVLIRLDADTKISSDLELGFFTTSSHAKTALLMYLLTEIIPTEKQLTIVFTSTKHHVEYLSMILAKLRISCAPVYGTMDAEARKLSVARFRAGQSRVLLVTDVASRGIDIPLLDNVINYDFPPRPKLFVHRVGRAARAGRHGRAFSFVAPDEMPFLLDLQLFLGRQLVLGSSPTTETDEAKTCIVLGSVPQPVIEALQDELKTLHQGSVDISNMEHVVNNAYKMYHKTRPVATPPSYTRAKEALATMIPVHPWFADKVDRTEEERLRFLTSIRSFRPSDAVFDIGKNGKKGRMVPRTRKVARPAAATSGSEDEATRHQALPSASEAQLKSSFRTIFGGDEGGRAGEEPKPAYRDEEHYIAYVPKGVHGEMGYAMSKDASFVEQARDAALDLDGEDASSMRRSKAALKWDTKKRNFVRPTVGSDNVKRIRTESGALIAASYKTNKYTEWREKNKIALSHTGAIEPPQLIRRKDGRWVPKRSLAPDTKSDWRRGNVLEDDGNAGGEREVAAKAKGKDKRKGQPASGGKGGKGGARKPRSELKSPEQILKQRRIKKRRDDHAKRRQAERARKNRGGAGKK